MATLFIAIAILYYSTVGTPPGSVGGTGGDGGGGGNGSLLSTNHAVAYAVLAWSLAYALANPDDDAGRSWWEAAVVVVAVSAYGLCLEAVQLFFPERFFDPVDMASNVVGVLSVAGWYAIEPYLEFYGPGGESSGTDGE